MSRMKMNAIAVGLVVALTAGFAFGFVVPGMRKLHEHRERVAAEAAQVQSEQQRLGAVSELYSSLVDLDKSMSSFRERLPQQRQFGEFLNSVSDNLKKAQIEDFTVQPKPPVSLDEAKLPADLAIAKGTIILPVRITFEGTLVKLMDFQQRMEDLPRLCHVESLKMKNDETRPGIVDVELLLMTFCYPN